jgi:hypothetical protein
MPVVDPSAAGVGSLPPFGGRHGWTRRCLPHRAGRSHMEEQRSERHQAPTGTHIFSARQCRCVRAQRSCAGRKVQPRASYTAPRAAQFGRQEACARRAPSASPAAHGCCCRVRRRRRQRRASTVTFSPATASTRDVRASGAMMCHCRYGIHRCCAPIPIMPCPSVRNTSDARSPERLHRHILRFVICAVLLELLRFRRAAFRALRPRQGWHAMQP